MILKRLKINAGIGDDTNCYIIADEKSKEAIVIDPAGEVDKIIDMINVLQVSVKYILITHCHGDHIGGVEELRNRVGGKVLVHILDVDGLYDENISLTYYIGMQNIRLEADSRLNDEDIIHIGDIEFKILHTPGHTKGSICLYCKEYHMLFSGDTLFRGTWGRTDLPTGSFEDIIQSITNKLMTLPDETIIYPGHGKSSIIKEEKPIYIELKPKLY
jgi:hydroxyacylglutathione hydrolase